MSSPRVLSVGGFGFSNLGSALHKLFSERVPEFYASIENEAIPLNFPVHVERFDHFSLLENNFSVVDCDPIGADLVEKMRECEATYLRMIERIDWREFMTYADRKRHYLKQLRFWNHYLKKNRINLAIFLNFPHEMYDYVIYSLCKLYGIKTLIFDDINFIPDTLFMIEKIEDSCLPIKVEYEKLKTGSDLPTLGKTLEYYETFHGAMKNTTPAMIQKLLLEKESMDNLLARLTKLSKKMRNVFRNPSKLIDVDRWYRQKHSLEKQEIELNAFYAANATSQPDLAKPYVFLALHFQPECSSCPMGGPFVDQELIAEMISKCLPEGYFLYVKEHPLQKKQGRSVELYKRVLDLPNARLIDKNFSSFSLVENAQATATLTGTAGWESFLKGKPVLKFGYSFYQYAPGVYRVHTMEDCISAMKSIVEGETHSQDDVKRYLAAIERASIDSWILDFLKKPMTKLSDEECALNIYEAMKTKLGWND